MQQQPGARVCKPRPCAAHSSLSRPQHLHIALPLLRASGGTTSRPRNGETDSSMDSTLIFPLRSKQLQMGDFRELKSLVSTHAVLREPLIILQIFLEPLANELWLCSSGNSSVTSSPWSPVPTAPCHRGAGPGTTPMPAPALRFKHLGGAPT